MEPSGCSVSAGDLTAGTSPIVGMYTYRQGQMKGGGGGLVFSYILPIWDIVETVRHADLGCTMTDLLW